MNNLKVSLSDFSANLPFLAHFFHAAMLVRVFTKTLHFLFGHRRAFAFTFESHFLGMQVILANLQGPSLLLLWATFCAPLIGRGSREFIQGLLPCLISRILSNNLLISSQARTTG